MPADSGAVTAVCGDGASKAEKERRKTDTYWCHESERTCERVARQSRNDCPLPALGGGVERKALGQPDGGLDVTIMYTRRAKVAASLVWAVGTERLQYT